MIKFRCSACNQKIGVPEDAAGRRLRCPKCRHIERVPGGQSAGVAASASKSKSEVGQESEMEDNSPLLESLEAMQAAEASAEGEDHHVSGGGVCPECRAPMKPTAVLCIQCGYSLQKQKKVRRSRRSPSLPSLLQPMFGPFSSGRLWLSPTGLLLAGTSLMWSAAMLRTDDPELTGTWYMPVAGLALAGGLLGKSLLAGGLRPTRARRCG